MTSKISFFDRALCRRAVKTSAPVWLIYTAYELILPFQLYAVCRGRSAYTEDFPAEITRLILNAAPAGASFVAFIFGGMLAWALFHWLFRANSTCFYASLPVRRETLFFTHYLTGLGLFCVPALVSSLLLWLIGSCFGVNVLVPAAQVFAATMLGAVLFFSFGVLVCSVVGQMAAMPLVYVILNFTAYVVEQIVSSLMETFVYGMPDGQTALMNTVANWLTPLVAINRRFYFITEWNEAGLMASCYMTGWKYLLVYAAVGLFFAAGAFFLLKQRQMERSGDVIAVRALRPVALYTFTFGCALVIGALIADQISGNAAKNFWYVLLFLLIGACAGYFSGQMLLQKTVHVFRTGWKGLAVCALVLTLVFGSAKLDLFGYSRYLPEREDIVSVSITRGDEPVFSQDEGLIDGIVRLHRAAVENKSEQERRTAEFLLGENYSQDFYLRYCLSDGRIVERYYTIVYNAADEAQPESLISQFRSLYTSPVCVRARLGFDTERTRADVLSCCISSKEDTGESKWVDAQAAWQLYEACVADIDAELLCADDITGKGIEEGNYTPLYLQFLVASARPGQTTDVMVDAIPITATHTVSVLTALGFDVYWSAP